MAGLTEQEKQDLFNRLKFETAVSASNTAAIQYGYQKESWLVQAVELKNAEAQKAANASKMQMALRKDGRSEAEVNAKSHNVNVLSVQGISRILENFLKAFATLSLTRGELTAVANVAQILVRRHVTRVLGNVPRPSARDLAREAEDLYRGRSVQKGIGAVVDLSADMRSAFRLLTNVLQKLDESMTIHFAGVDINGPKLNSPRATLYAEDIANRFFTTIMRVPARVNLADDEATKGFNHY